MVKPKPKTALKAKPTSKSVVGKRKPRKSKGGSVKSTT
jgi:hypothetical protein